MTGWLRWRSRAFTTLIILCAATACLPTFPAGSPVAAVDPPAPRASVNPVRIGKAVRGDLTGILNFTAQLRAKGEVSIVPRVTARVDRVLVDVGARVRIGDNLVELDKTELEAQVLQAQATQSAAEAKLAELKAGPKAEVVAQAQANQRAAQARVNTLESARSNTDSAAADKRVEDARAALDQAQAALQPDAQAVAQADSAVNAARSRLQQLQGDPARANDKNAMDAARNDVTKAEADAAKARTPKGTQAAVDQARRELQDAEQARLLVRLSTTAFDLDQARALVEVANAELKLAQADATPGEQRAAEANVEQSSAQAELARARLRDATLTAPINAIVAEIKTSVGTTVGPGTSIMTLIPPELQVVVQADEALIPQLQIGQPANLSVESFPKDAFTGTVKGVAPVLDPRTRSVAVSIEVADPQGKLRPGMFTQLGVQTGQRQAALIVPRDSVLKVGAIDPNAPPVNVVYTVAESRVHRQVVALGVSDGKSVEIVSGLTEGVDLVLNPRPDFLEGELISAN
ncbi:MAG TPA: efflux RND transporter periplasmic adaptor subunit [Chloroflexota bacterium]|nr:efflux RND transporter periplasmic adaptor subunit [Chloroflexota bacterium]